MAPEGAPLHTRPPMPRLLRRVETLVPRRSADYGGKARNLAALARAGFPVPAAYAMSGAVCEDFLRGVLAPDELPSALLRDRVVDPRRLEAIASKVRDAPLSADLRRALADAFATLRREGARSLAVRSSSTREDQQEASAAGLHETVLNVMSEAELFGAVKHCWASLFTPRVMVYLERLGGRADAAVGVVIQAMVPAEVAGVLFTVNPLTGDAGEVVINASYGLGSAVVDGCVSPDTLRIDKATGAPRDRIIGAKAIRRVLTEGGGVVDEPVPPEERDRLCLDEAEVEALTTLALRIEDHFGAPRDVEWAIAQGSIYVLQARPITVAIAPSTRRRSPRKPPRIPRASIVWSNVNVGEALPGVPTPLTWSVLSNFSELGFRRAFGSLGCTVPKDAELVGSFRGRIYLNMTEFMSILSQVPGLRPRTLLALGGGGEVERLEAAVERRSPIGFLARLPLTAARFARENLGLTSRLTELETSFAAERRRLLSVDARILSATALDRMLTDAERLLDETGAVMLTVYGNLLGTVVALSTGLGLLFDEAEAERLRRDLLSGIADLDSAAPGVRLWHIAEMARQEEAAAAVIREGDPATLKLTDLPEGPTRRALERFLEAYGHRGVREAELAEPRWREDPTLLFATLANHLEHPRPEGERPIDVERRLRAKREVAERQVLAKLPSVAAPAFRHLLHLAQRFTRLREHLRGLVVEVLGILRIVALEASRRMAHAEPEAGTDAAFFLTLDELHEVLRREGVPMAARVRQRRRQLERDRSLPDPPDTFVGYPPAVPEPLPATDALRGLAASSGRVVGRARVVGSAAEAAQLVSGEILVAGSADVGWAPLFLVAAAVVTDLGGPLSHAAIVLREYAVPAVVNVKIGTRVIRSGDLVEVDGDAGTVRVIERAAADAPPPETDEGEG